MLNTRTNEVLWKKEEEYWIITFHALHNCTWARTDAAAGRCKRERAQTNGEVSIHFTPRDPLDHSFHVSAVILSIIPRLFLRTHTIWRNESYGDTTPRTQHDFTNGQIYFHSAPRQTGMGRQWRKVKFSWYFKVRYSAIHPLTIFHSAFSCSNINSFSWERRARLVNDCSSCVTPTGLPHCRVLLFTASQENLAFNFLAIMLREIKQRTRSVCLYSLHEFGPLRVASRS